MSISSHSCGDRHEVPPAFVAPVSLGDGRADTHSHAANSRQTSSARQMLCGRPVSILDKIRPRIEDASKHPNCQGQEEVSLVQTSGAGRVRSQVHKDEM
jgi:hypothetical protein